MRIARIGDAMTDHYDPLETSGPAKREADLFSWLTDVLREAMAIVDRGSGICFVQQAWISVVASGDGNRQFGEARNSGSTPFASR
jgi:hypothetical protein